MEQAAHEPRAGGAGLRGPGRRALPRHALGHLQAHRRAARRAAPAPGRRSGPAATGRERSSTCSPWARASPFASVEPTGQVWLGSPHAPALPAHPPARPGPPHHHRRALRLDAHRPLRRGGVPLPRLPQGLPGQGALRDVRHHARGPADARARRQRGRHPHPRRQRARRAAPSSSSRAASTPERSTARTRASGCCGTCSRARWLPGVLGQVTVVFVPVFNVDGHERFGPNNRPNQVGPEEMGWRVTAQNLNLNRDYVKADAPEMGALLTLPPRVGPARSTSISTSPTARSSSTTSSLDRRAADARPPSPCARWARSCRTRSSTRLRAAGAPARRLLPVLRQGRRPDVRLRRRASRRRASATATGPLHGRFGMLVETHSWKPYAHAREDHARRAGGLARARGRATAPPCRPR